MQLNTFNMWNRKDYPTAKDADENGDILILRNNGRKSIYNWEDFCDEKLLAKDIGWMPLPPSDNVEDETKQISIAITAGDRSWTIENRGFTIEIHDSRDPMGQPSIFAVTADTNMNGLFAEAVLSVLESKDEDEDWCECEGEGVAVNDVEFNVDVELQGFIDAIRGSVPASRPPQKKRGK